MKLNVLQSELEHIYDVSTPHRVEDFLVQDPQLAAALAQGSAGHDTPEKLLVAQCEDGLDVALYLHGAVLGRLAQDNPAKSLHAGNLEDFWLAVEGVSHFLYLAWNAAFERPITQLELELVAEIDKFVTAASLVHEQQGSAPTQAIRRVLFEGMRLRDGLEETVRQRYYEANRLAARYCQTLERRYDVVPEDPALFRELRRFYRMSKPDKIRHIETATPTGA
jgi:hypothetical protein